MSKNFPVDDEGNWLSLPTEDPDPRHQLSDKRIWKKSNPIVLSFIEQVKDIAPMHW